MDVEANLIVIEMKQDVAIGINVIDKYKLTWDWNTHTVQSGASKKVDVSASIVSTDTLNIPAD